MKRLQLRFPCGLTFQVIEEKLLKVSEGDGWMYRQSEVDVRGGTDRVLWMIVFMLLVLSLLKCI